MRWLRRATSIRSRSDAAWGALADAAMLAGEKDEALDAARRAVEFAPSDPAHRTRLQKLERGDATPGLGMIELDFGGLLSSGGLESPQQKESEELDLSRSLDQIFIR